MGGLLENFILARNFQSRSKSRIFLIFGPSGNFSFSTYNWSFFAYNLSFLTYNWSSFAYNGKVRLISALRDCKQRTLTVSKQAPTVSKKFPPLACSELHKHVIKHCLSARALSYSNSRFATLCEKSPFTAFCPPPPAIHKEREGQGR